MKLTALRLHNVRRFAGRGVAVEGIGDGVNVLCAVNEFGKSTCFDALHALFFQPHTGTPSAVQGLRPYSGGNPLVEADITTANGAFRLTKQFYGGKRAMVRELASGRLVAQADEAERFIANLVQGGTAGPAGLLWVRQGITGIERRARSDEEGEKRARESVLTSVQGEVESLTGGRRMAQALAACEAELAPLVTATGRPKAGGAYAQALEERDALAQHEQKLAGELRELRDALDRRRSLRARLAELDDAERHATLLREVAQAEAALAAARAHGEALRTAEVEAALARNARDAAREALDTLRRDLARLALLREREAESRGRRDEALARQRAANEAGLATATEVERAEAGEREARELLARLDKAMRAREAGEKLARLRQEHERAAEGRAEIETIEAELKALRLPAGALARLETLESELVGLRATAAARRPLLRVAYDPGVAAAIQLDGAALDDEEERTLSGAATLTIQGVGRLAITLPQGGDDEADLARAEAKRTALLAELAVADLAEARRRDSAASELNGRLDLARQRLRLLAPDGLPALQEQIARLEAQGAGAEEAEGDPETARASLVETEGRVVAARRAQREAQAARDAANAAVVETERALAGIASELAGLAATLGPERERDALEAQRSAALAQAQQGWSAAQAQRDALRAGAVDIAGAEAKLRRMRSVLDGALAEIAALREEAAELNGRIRARADAAVEEAWQEASEKLGAAQRRVVALEREVALLTRLRAALEAARAEARDHYFAPVMTELRPLLGLLFEDATVTFDEETLLPRTVSRNGLEEPVGVLSGGMREQLAVLTRLAFARLLAKDGQPAPVILDDALVYSDDDRIERMFDALHRQASGQQIIVFSCRQRAFAQLGGTILRMVPWVPEG
ncbi:MULTISPECIES: AAA family ATPase [Hyphomicrobiales]|jgi:DNA repair exonuclease SbcCD ATPase subunit|uniref:DNA-binding protein n=1 Tax=Bosea massiliensis TaxID=151419 RepID=A0ABW0P916_9HYPH|nr:MULTISPECIES: DNA-binding protein [Hyphomicrobiales]